MHRFCDSNRFVTAVLGCESDAALVEADAFHRLFSVDGSDHDAAVLDVRNNH